MVIEDLQQKTKFQEVFLTPKHASATVQLYNRSSTENQHIKISVIMPAFNEEHVVGQLIDRTHKIIRKITNDYEIIVINDGSKDRTLDICREKNVILIHNHQNWGKGYALREGFKYARGDILITLDSDGDHHPEEIPQFFKSFLKGKTDVTLGTRFVNKRKNSLTSALNIFRNKLFNFLIHCIFMYSYLYEFIYSYFLIDLFTNSSTGIYAFWCPSGDTPFNENLMSRCT